MFSMSVIGYGVNARSASLRPSKHERREDAGRDGRHKCNDDTRSEPGWSAW